MKHHTLEQLQTIAQVEPCFDPDDMTRRQRLERWAELLELIRYRHLDTLHETEFQVMDERNALRCDYSPITIAFRDPVLRAAGMETDTYGEAKRFFEISDDELHDVVCYCRFGTTVSAAVAARQVRSLLADKPKGFWASVAGFFIGRQPKEQPS
ncbi:hypothetical protein [Sinorhizobium sp. GL28]|uniref:hypothetical protein n=1 Tax=Sinorhizobium sp. GL28 TaxID=1358418 RepID=UPI00071D6DBB|nr:hypothetical protein [Sinorhizobium sp. GL28]KSV95110.1 hypothetical protein N184_35665 [Sinorhizobium sp. GL28]